ncbi:DUF47 domain-containing protein [Candidatus Skiveiella danica]|uniref:DUF47 domain-containing protein n=1 Tax=Candidatus Skiveiella danica TaxID=3386177 RepID=UPI0039B8A15A
MLNNVMPQRGAFFSLLIAHTDRLVAAANATLRLITGLGNPHVDIAALIDEVNLNETSADDLKDQLIHLLYESFTTPINRDQIHTLTMDLDRVVDSIQSVANSIATHHIADSTPPGPRDGLARRRCLHPAAPRRAGAGGARAGTGNRAPVPGSR